VKDGVTYYFIDNEYYFKRGALYGYGDEAERYAFFCKAAVEMLGVIGFYPDVLHAHDWQAALSITYLNFEYRWRREYQNIKTVFTIHNIEYQGQFPNSVVGFVFGFGHSDYLDYNGCINLMKCAIEMANVVTTVSPRYAEEIRSNEYAHGLAPILEKNAHKLTGILNGIDYDYYNPESDYAIYEKFTSGDIEKKRRNKTELQKSLGLPVREDVPLVAIVSRLASHKGLDLVRDVAYRLVDNHDIQLVILGKGEAQYENFFVDLERCRHDKVRALMLYDRDLSKCIYAAADIFLMPSKSEPCGLSQMIASRYGAIPVVRETGGLYDSIKGYWLLNGTILGNGFTFANYSSEELYERTNAAIELYHNNELYPLFMKKIMDTDFSWGTSARKYYMLYERM
jgi:starch synthase